MWLFPLSPSLITSGTAARWQISDCLYELMPALWRWQSAIIESSGMTVRSRHPALSWRPHGDCQHRRCLRCLGRGQDKSCLPTATWSVKLINSNELGMVRKYATAVSDRSLVRSLVPRTAGKLEHTRRARRKYDVKSSFKCMARLAAHVKRLARNSCCITLRYCNKVIHC